ncbi:hypothetical protein LEMLEM_LOCUS8603 [Lemmus lemmus]
MRAGPQEGPWPPRARFDDAIGVCPVARSNPESAEVPLQRRRLRQVTPARLSVSCSGPRGPLSSCSGVVSYEDYVGFTEKIAEA